MLRELLLKHDSDKEVHHKYGLLYEMILKPYQDKKFLEIGTTGMGGGSVKAFKEYFNSEIYGIDISPPNEELGFPQIQGDAYKKETIKFIEESWGKMDVILDDGPHTLESHYFLFENYPDLINDGGLIICEDCAAFYSVDEMIEMIKKLDLYCIDLTSNTGSTAHDYVLIKKVG